MDVIAPAELWAGTPCLSTAAKVAAAGTPYTLGPAGKCESPALPVAFLHGPGPAELLCSLNSVIKSAYS